MRCGGCGEPVFGGPGVWHTADGRERCPEGGFHEPDAWTMLRRVDPPEFGVQAAHVVWCRTRGDEI